MEGADPYTSKALGSMEDSFQIGERLASFIVFDVVLMPGMPTTRRRVECEVKDKFNIDIGKLAIKHMAETITVEKRQVEA